MRTEKERGDPTRAMMITEFLPNQKFWRWTLYKLWFLEIITMFLYSHILGHNIVGCLQGYGKTKANVLHMCVCDTVWGRLEEHCIGKWSKVPRKRECLLTANTESPLYWVSVWTFRVQKTVRIHEVNSFWRQNLWRGVIKYWTVNSNSNVIFSLTRESRDPILSFIPKRHNLKTLLIRKIFLSDFCLYHGSSEEIINWIRHGIPPYLLCPHGYNNIQHWSVDGRLTLPLVAIGHKHNLI